MKYHPLSTASNEIRIVCFSQLKSGWKDFAAAAAAAAAVAVVVVVVVLSFFHVMRGVRKLYIKNTFMWSFDKKKILYTFTFPCEELVAVIYM